MISLSKIAQRSLVIGAVAFKRPIAAFGTAAVKKGSLEPPHHNKHLKYENPLKMATVDHLGNDSIVKMWTDHHQFEREEPLVAGGISHKVYETLAKRMSENNKFILPLPRKEGFEPVLVQGNPLDQVSFFPLPEKGKEKNDENPALSLKFFTNLANSKKLVLFLGTIEETKLSIDEGKYLTYLLITFYTGPQEGYSLINQFQKRPEKFEISQAADLVRKYSMGNPSRI